MIYFVSIFILLFIISATVIIVLKTNINHTNIFCSLWMHDIETNMYITYTLDGYIKDRNIGPDDYIVTGEKPVKIDSYRTSIIVVDILNGLDTIIFVDIAYCLIFLVNIVSAKHF